ncbi:N-methyl-L-tryptophan oxidase [Pseudonocardia halophobica]|uniref:N-methyltryptophan oxidase n=1 Tax=Pseudonocardia halophobica TaxID=29401 RepID=A0A9W6NYD0_9PSEU|nr:N-methyl-L-tryptophan oxidase [Pseudonocardia halophobica]GLL13631.1 N-methyltryptophan oxidase [Pseudonocardia halophobica]
MSTRYDAVVVGLGAFGSQALWALARRGLRVAGIEQFPLGHALGSSHGVTRLFRVACLEHPGLVPLAQRSLALWRELEDTACTPLLDQTGGLMAGPPSGRAVGGTRRAAAAHHLDIEDLTVEQLRDRFPQHAGLPDHYEGVWDPGAGVLRPEAAIGAALDAARALGATVLEGVRVTGLTDGGVATALGTVHAEQVVVTAGPWLSDLVPQVATTVRRVPLTWFGTRPGYDPAAFDLKAFPVFIRHYDDERTIWGHGAALGEPAKVGLSPDPDQQPAVHPDTIDRSVDAATDWARLGTVLKRTLPGLDPTPAKARPCMITMSADGQFVVGRLPGRERVVVAGGCSGHGFKHASGVGDVVARIVADENQVLDAAFLDPARFS